MYPVEGDVEVSIDGKDTTYSAEYGSKCEDWDNSQDANCKGDTAPEYCREKWCYVSPDKCKKKNKKSLYLPNSTSDGGHSIYYSYDTCGGTDKFASATAATSSEGASVSFGSSSCPCIGIDDLTGHIDGVVGGKKVSFPADLGAHCSAWDESTPGCPGQDFCAEQWCYVDPCNCAGLDELPKESAYLPDAEYQGHGVYYSYATCGSPDKYTKDDSKDNREGQIKKSCSKEVDATQWGEEDCRCTGMYPVEGDVEVSIDGKDTTYSAEYGSKCEDWDNSQDAKCKGDKAPEYCREEWCYVNPDKCKKTNKKSLYLPNSTSDGGHSIYYSYDTCGGTDKFASL
jgi:hypothetical protein